jgi:hypothetical protein
MKRLIFTIISIGLVFLSSCQRGPSYLVTDNTEEIKNLTPACIIWYKPGKTGCEVNKSWSQEDEMNKIKELLIKADKTMVYTVGEYKLSLIFYDGYPENLKLYEVRFTLTGKSFRGSIGSSKELGEFLSEYKPEERILIIPSGDPNRAKEVQERLMQGAERRKKEKEATQPEQ